MQERLKKRRDFLAAARGSRAGCPAFVLQVFDRGDMAPARFGFTVSKRTAAKAVERNRMKRRLRQAVELVGPAFAKPGVDYVLVARTAALKADFAEITGRLAEAMSRSRTHAGSRKTPGARPG